MTPDQDSFSPEKRRRLADRLSRATDRTDTGQVLPRTADALAVANPVGRVLALAEALRHERLIVPVPVEAHPDASGEHGPQDLCEDTQVPLPVAQSPSGQAIVVFSSAEQLLRWDPQARPMVMRTQKVSLTALAVGVPRLWLNPVGDSLLLPRALVESHAHGDSWLPAWQDEELLAELRGVAAQSALPAIVKIVPSEMDPKGWWNVGIRVQVLLGSGSAEATDRLELQQLLASLAAVPRLQVAAEAIEFVPQILPVA